MTQVQLTDQQPGRKSVPKCKDCKHFRQNHLRRYNSCYHPEKKIGGFLGTWIKSEERRTTSPNWCPLRKEKMA